MEKRNAEPVLSQYLNRKGRALGLPISGTFELTARCNFNCKMCYVHLSEEEQRRRGCELTAEQWLTIAEQARTEGTVFLLLTGGEPTLRPDFPELYRALKHMGFMISLNSNGYLLQGSLLKLLQEEPPTRCNISLYGVSNETYEALCGIPAYDRVLRNINALRDAGIDVKINMSITPENSADMPAVFAQAKRLGVHTQASSYLFPPIRIHPGQTGQNDRMPPEQAGEYLKAYDSLCLSESEFRQHAEQLEKRIGDAAENAALQGNRMTCRAGSCAFWLTWDGKMLPCGQMAEPAADVLHLGFSEAWRQTRQAAAQIRLPTACAACSYRNICHVCAAMCYCETGRFDGKPEYMCRMTEHFAQSTIREELRQRTENKEIKASADTASPMVSAEK